MNWQEYQDAVGELYAQMDNIGEVQKNITLSDKVIGQARQVDVWLAFEIKGHTIGILVDAKYRKEKLDVKDIEEVISFANAVGANKSVIVAVSGWTEPAEVKARSVGVDLKLWTLEQALDPMVPDKWMMCPACENDCVVLDRSGGMVIDGMWSFLAAGQCRECNTALAWCWACGEHMLLHPREQAKCSCRHSWKNEISEVLVKPHGEKQWSIIPK